MGLIHATIRAIICALIGVCLPAFAENVTEGWTWGVACPGDGAWFSTAYFTTGTTAGFEGVGNCTRTSTHFTQFSFNSDNSGGAGGVLDSPRSMAFTRVIG